MKQFIKYPLKLIGFRALFIVATVFLSSVFIGPIATWTKGDLGLKLYSTVICSLYMGIIYDAGWKMAKLDKKPYTATKPYVIKGFVLALLSETIPIIILICNVLFKQTNALQILRLLYVATMLPFIGFLGNKQQLVVPASYIIALFIVPVFSGLGYFTGLRNKTDEESFLRKIMYKQKKEN